jgi:predicted alpha/beta-hydrolase family hydrolase
MAKIEPRKVSFDVDSERRVSGLLIAPKKPSALYVLAHGAGAGMAHPFLATMAALLAERGIATFRYQFPYMEKKSRRPDPPKVAEAAVRAAVAEAKRLAPGLPTFAGGKSFGGRMTSQAESGEHLPGVLGLAFLGFPLHPPGAPAVTRGEHLKAVRVPMLFLQGDRDEFAELKLLKPLVKKLPDATLHLIPGGNHSFRVPAAAGRKEADVMAELADTLAAWIDGIAAA